MKLKTTSGPFTFEAGERTVLLLHGFTGHSGDVRMLGRFLQKHGYTTHAPVYRGHGQNPEDILKFRPSDWLEDVNDAYQHLKTIGYDKIAVAGLSLGGVFSLILGYTMPVKGIIPMCAPIVPESQKRISENFKDYVVRHEKMVKTPIDKMEEKLNQMEIEKCVIFKEVERLLKGVREHLDLIYAPAFVVQAKADTVIDPENATIIYNEIESTQKQIKFYDQAPHAITLSAARGELHEDILTFLNGLDW